MAEFVHKLSGLPQRADAAHKGTSGRVAIIAGSVGMSGAAVLAGMGALRGGAGLVRIYTPELVWPLIATAEPCLMVTPVETNQRGGISSKEFEAEHVPKLVQSADVIAVGPGMGRSPGTGRVARAVVAAAREQKIVIDADALTSEPGELVAACRVRAAGSTIFTPHPGEIAHLLRALNLECVLDESDAARTRAASAAAAATGAVVLLKGHRTVVADAERLYVNTTGNPGMATGGMGDVLTGLIAALVAQGLPAFDAACLAANVHGAAGDLLARDFAPLGFTARDLAVQIPGALAQHYGRAWDGV